MRIAPQFYQRKQVCFRFHIADIWRCKIRRYKFAVSGVNAIVMHDTTPVCWPKCLLTFLYLPSPLALWFRRLSPHAEVSCWPGTLTLRRTITIPQHRALPPIRAIEIYRRRRRRTNKLPTPGALISLHFIVCFWLILMPFSEGFRDILILQLITVTWNAIRDAEDIDDIAA